MESSKVKVLQLGTIKHAVEMWADIAEIADIVVPTATNRSAFLEECCSGALDGVMVAYSTFESISRIGRMDAELLDALPLSLKFICHNGAGYDNIDVAFCHERGIFVSNTPAVVDESTSNLHIFLMLGALRNLAPALASIRTNQWRGLIDPPLGRDPEGKVLGILGMGGIGSAVARKAHAAFGMRVRYHNRKQLSLHLEQAAGDAQFVNMTRLLAESDVLSINVPLNSSTHHLLGPKQFAQMKKGIVIVNTARGSVIDEEALLAALQSGQVASAGLDVFEHEPHVRKALLASDKVFLSPHMGTWTLETETRMERLAVGNVRHVIEEDEPLTPVPEQA